MVRPALVFVVAAVAIGFVRAPEAVAQPAHAKVEQPVVHAHEVKGLTVDGKLDEAIYASVAPVTEFIQQEPRAGEPTTERTEVWVLFDEKNLYVSGRMWDSEPHRIIANEMRRDAANDIVQNENFSISLDTFNDHRSGYYFMTNPLGAMRDVQFVSERQVNAEFNPVWNPKCSRFAGGWLFEIAIPFKSIRYPGEGPQTWGIQFRRIIRWKQEHAYLTRIPAAIGASGVYRMESAARLEGVRTPAVGRNIDIKPYVIGRSTTDRVTRPVRNNDADADFGADLKYGITKSVTADLTYNTDFAQVEDDLQQVNLTRFGLFFPEKREFFLEGQGIFDFGGQSNGGNSAGGDTPTMFFSRQIGLTNGVAVPIQGGARLTGKVGKYTVGFVDIQTAESEAARAPATNFGVFRLRRDIFTKSYVGVLATERNPSHARDNRLLGVDANLAFNLTTVTLYYAQTRTAGREGRDASFTAGYDYNGDRYGATVQHLTVEPNFNPEVGFLRRQNFRTNTGTLRFSPRPRRRFTSVRKFTYSGTVNNTTSTDGTLETRIAQGDAKAEYQTGDTVSVTAVSDREVLAAPFRIATGVTIPVGDYHFSSLGGTYVLGARHRVRGTFTGNVGSFYDGTRRSAGFTGRVSLHRVILEPSLSSNWIALPWGGFRTTLVSTRTTYTLSPRTAIGALVQYNSNAHSLSTNVRLRWEYTPGSDFFLVFTEGRTTVDPDRFAPLQNRTVVAKFTRLFRY